MSYDFNSFYLFDIRDKETGRNRCRFCSKVIPRGRKKYYCSGECRDKFYWSYSWERIRKEVLIRDNHKCIICTTDLALHDSKVQVVNTHHKVSVRELRRLAWSVIKYMEDNEERRRAGIIVMLFLTYDKDNLISLCVKCHRRVEGNRLKRKRFVDYFFTLYRGRLNNFPKYLAMNNKWNRFLKLNENELIQMRITKYFN